MKKCIFQIFLFIAGVSVYGQSTATYDIVFTSNWEAHGPLPGSSAHFTELVGATHNSNITFFELGGIATPGVEEVAETGADRTFSNEVNRAISAGNASQYIKGPNLFFNGSLRTITIKDVSVDTNHPLISLISMIAPSPDWIAAVNSISLLGTNNEWIQNLTMDIFPYDAGTEEGTGYSLNNPPTNPKEPISSIRGMYTFNNQKIGTIVFTRTDTPEPVDGGTITGGPFTFTVGDGIADNVSGVTLDGNIGENSQWVVTDDQGNIL
ncbi:spondin domain-containing protein, partial [Aquimarina sp. RZ0]|uniref:spondin domain-containing protein n=1 Tax=Aquimarina sp. RZ0 TaxID=2607730 RepID=UPI0011F10433